MVKRLIAAGANVNKADKSGRAALIRVSGAGEEGKDEKRQEIAELLIEKGTTVNANTKKGTTALMSASMLNNEDTARLLIEKGAKVDGKDNRGETALMRASAVGALGAIAILLTNGADVNEQEIPYYLNTSLSKA